MCKHAALAWTTAQGCDTACAQQATPNVREGEVEQATGGRQWRQGQALGNGYGLLAEVMLARSRVRLCRLQAV